MKFLFTILIPLSINAQSNLEVFESTIAEKGTIQYANNLEELIGGEKWGWHSGKIGEGQASSSLAPYKGITYSIENIYDLNLTTAWVEDHEDYGIGECVSFTLSGVDKSDPYQFFGIIEIFNGYCKSLSAWQNNSRVKSLKVYLNDSAIAIINLKDTWQYQRVDIRRLFSQRMKQPEQVVYELKDKDILMFEILDIYEGDKYKDVAISEFVFDASSN